MLQIYHSIVGDVEFDSVRFLRIIRISYRSPTDYRRFLQRSTRSLIRFPCLSKGSVCVRNGERPSRQELRTVCEASEGRESRKGHLHQIADNHSMEALR